jgi:putative membrane protein
MYEWHGYGGGMMWIFWILLIGILAGFVVFAARGASNRSGQEKSALEILKERYARGEIDREEFAQKKQDLEH